MCAKFFPGFWVAYFSEIFVWGLSPFLFLAVYVCIFNAPFSVVLPHFFLIFVIWLISFGLRLLSWRFTTVLGGGVRQVAAVLLFLTPPLMLWFWYAMALLGLASWGRVTTWQIFKSYVFQAGYLTDVLGASWWLFFLAALLLLVVFYCVYKLINKIDLSFFAFRMLSGTAQCSVFMLGILGALILFFVMPGQSYRHPLEPMVLSFFSNDSSTLQSHALYVAPSIDAAEIKELSGYRRTSNFNRRNVIFIVGDALRPDHMSFYGYTRNTTPYLDASSLEYQTLRVRHMRSVCAESSCGLMALASSRPLHLFPSKPITLHSVLRQNGYKVSLVLSGDHTNFYGLKEAYGNVDNYYDGTHQSRRYMNDDALLDDYVDKLPQYDGQYPIMFQFHLMSTHGLGLRHKESTIFEPAVNYYGWPAGRGRRAPSLGEVPKAINYYDNGVAGFDRVVDGLLKKLSAKGYLENAVIVITGDHGEMLGEKQIFGHQYSVDEEVLRIPFILQRRGYVGEVLGDWPMASQVDVAPTILSELGIEPPLVWRGTPLQSPAEPRVINFQQSPRVGFYVTDDSPSLLKYWRDSVTGAEYVFDVEKDSGETENVISHIDEGILASWRVSASRSAVSEADKSVGN